MPKHNWVEMRVVPIQADLIKGLDGEEPGIITSSEEGADVLAQLDSIDICWNCQVPLSTETIDQECPEPEGSKEVDGVLSAP